jgi:glycosyltransferase involved in cell wall biosynthesis
MKKIIIIHPHFTIMGGAGRVMLELGKNLASKYEIWAISQKANRQTIKNYPEINFDSINGPTTNKYLFWLLFPYWQLKTYRALTKHLNPETIIFCSVFPSNWMFFPLRFFIKNKIFWFCQEPSAFIQDDVWIESINSISKKFIARLLRPVFKLLDFQLAKIPDVILANSEFSREKIQKIYHRQAQVFHPGVDTTIFKPIPYPKKENYIVTVSRLTKFKNIDVLIKAFSRFRDTKSRLKIIGQGEELDNLKTLSTKLKIEKRVDFLTDVSDSQLIPLLQKAKLFVLCSKNEPFGIVPVEAMACGTPVIADNSGGLKETVAQNHTGKLIDNLNPENLAEVLKMGDIQIRRWSENGHAHVKKYFSWENQTKKIIKILNPES